MSDARLRELERRWRTTPASSEAALNYLNALARANLPVELSAFPAPLFANREFRATLDTFKRAGVPTHQLIYEQPASQVMDASFSESLYHPGSQSFPNMLATAIPEVNLEAEDDFSLVTLYWVPAGAALRSGSLTDALKEAKEIPGGVEVKLHATTKEHLLLAIIRSEYITEVHDDLQETSEDILTYRYYSVYHWYREGMWRTLPSSGYVYGEEAPVEDPGLLFNHGNMLYRLYGDPNEERRLSAAALTSIAFAEDAVSNYRNSVAGTINQTEIDILEEYGQPGFMVRLIDRFDETIIADWHDDEISKLQAAGHFSGTISDESGSPFHVSVFQYAQLHRMLPWQQTHHDETGHIYRRNPIRVHTWRGWITPGDCDECGSHRDWEIDGRGDIYCRCQIPADEYEHEEPEEFDWGGIEIRPNTLEEITTTGYVNWMDGPILSEPMLVLVENITPVETGKHPETVLDIATMIRDEEWFRPIVVDEEGHIIDGHHRLLAMEHLGADQIYVQEITYPERNPGELRSWHAAIGPAPFKGTVLLAFGTREALAKASRHFGVHYRDSDVEYGTGDGGVPMLTVLTTDGRYLQIWLKG